MSLRKFLNFDLKNYNTFRIEAKADVAYFAENEQDVLEAFNQEQNLTVIGKGSNVLFSSKGVKDKLLFLNDMDKIKDFDDKIYVECGVKSAILSKWAKDMGYSGFEFLAPIPSSVGGNIFMNASAHGQKISDILHSARFYDRLNKKIEETTNCDFGYRCSMFSKNPKRYVILGGYFKKIIKNKDEIQKRIDEILSERQNKQPSMKTPNAGSIFKNPNNDSAGRLIEACNFKGTKCGGAMVSDIHANFIINFNNATSFDIVNLMSKIQKEVYNKFSIKLEPEIIFLGEKGSCEEIVWQK